jgi:hypothetical protein
VEDTDMNIDTLKIGHYVLTTYAGRKHTLYNEYTGDVYNILPSEYAWMQDNRSVETCRLVEDGYYGGRK